MVCGRQSMSGANDSDKQSTNAISSVEQLPCCFILRYLLRGSFTLALLNVTTIQSGSACARRMYISEQANHTKKSALTRDVLCAELDMGELLIIVEIAVEAN